VLGASFDTPAENRAFAEDQQFTFRLLSDVDKEVGTAYEVVRPAGADFPDFPMRIAYLIDPDGIVRKAYEVKDVGGFAAEVLADLAAQRAGGG
jgi:peroxiredoxin Q/BCP